MTKKVLTTEELNSQENLTQEIVNSLQPVHSYSEYKDRPHDSFIELMNWARHHFRNYLAKEDKEVNILINNRIIIDGAFLHFCKTNNINVKCLYRESIASWAHMGNSDECEKFAAQGLFLIESEGFKFIQASMFHKGTDNDDEVSFFVILCDSSYDKYMKFRRHYADWCEKRDKINSEIAVIGGDNSSYSRDLTWDDIFLPEDIKKEIITSVEGWLESKEVYENAKIPWKRGVLLWGPPGNGKTSIIRTIISVYDFKPITIQFGNDSAVNLLNDAFDYAKTQSPALIFLEDIDHIVEDLGNISHFLNVLDGVNSNNGIFVVGTANDLSSLDENLINRPSRFDRKWKIPKPSAKQATSYLKDKFNDLFEDSEYKSLGAKIDKKGLSYVHLKDIYLTSAFNAVAKDREKPNQEDVKMAFNQIITDKQSMAEMGLVDDESKIEI